MALPVLHVGEWMRFDGDRYQVVALAGTSVRLRSHGGATVVVVLAFLLAAPDFELPEKQQAAPRVQQFGLRETLLSEELAPSSRPWCARKPAPQVAEVNHQTGPGPLPPDGTATYQGTENEQNASCGG